MNVFDIYGRDAYWVVNKAFAREYGIMTTVFFSELIFHSPAPGEWFNVTHQEIENETGISYHIQKQMIEQLIEGGYVEKKREGVPYRNFYKILTPSYENFNNKSLTGCNSRVERGTTLSIYNKRNINKGGFVELWNELRTEYLKKPSFLNRLSQDQEQQLGEIEAAYSPEQIREAMIGLFKQKQMINGMEALRTDPKHFLTNFERYLSAYHSKDSNIWGEKKNYEHL